MELVSRQLTRYQLSRHLYGALLLLVIRYVTGLFPSQTNIFRSPLGKESGPQPQTIGTTNRSFPQRQGTQRDDKDVRFTRHETGKTRQHLRLCYFQLRFIRGSFPHTPNKYFQKPSGYTLNATNEVNKMDHPTQRDDWT